MRFVLLVAGATATGALCGGGIGTVFPQTKEMFAAVTALGGDWSNFSVTLNPIRATYDYVVREVTTGDPSRRLNFQTSPMPSLNLNPVNVDALTRPQFKVDNDFIKRAAAAGINSRIQQDMNRARDFQAYGRNPMGWHGAPPH